ncbi:hypothetical protein GCM10009001_34670 [Virgibacillus siamensis]|uniref:HTH merR-type domain-containing protein n=1 Tax=Virgibacillus siamensis TaxID=480071 RepID=A0ABN1GM75_9BACI
MELLSVNGLCHLVGVPQDTIMNWVEDFNFYIPEKNFQNVTYYHSEAIDVLKFIKKCKEQGYEKKQIMEMLTNNNIPVPVEKTMEDEQQALDYDENYRENILTVMQTIGKTVANVANQKETLDDLQEQQHEHNKRIKNTEKQLEEINKLKQEIQSLKQEHTPAKEYEMKKESFAKLFKNNS